MSESKQVEQPVQNVSAGHLSVRVEGQHPDDVPFLFEQQGKRMAPALVAALAAHVLAVGLIVFLVRNTPARTEVEAILPDAPSERIVWLTTPGPGGGGGGGGNQSKLPPQRAQLPGKDKITVPVKPAPALEAPKPKPVEVEPDPVQQLNIPAKSLADAALALPGQIEAPPGPPTASLGPGRGGGAGTGTGTGVGSGTGSGLGPGTGGGTGGGVYQLGSGVTTPVPIFQPTPQYTSDAMRARVQGVAVVSCIVRPDGTVSDVEVIRSLDSTFGLDGEAVKAARRWRFKPGTLRGEPVAVRIVIEMSFTLR
jgi:TonB family protein